MKYTSYLTEVVGVLASLYLAMCEDLQCRLSQESSHPSHTDSYGLSYLNATAEPLKNCCGVRERFCGLTGEPYVHSCFSCDTSHILLPAQPASLMSKHAALVSLLAHSMLLLVSATCESKRLFWDGLPSSHSFFAPTGDAAPLSYSGSASDLVLLERLIWLLASLDSFRGVGYIEGLSRMSFNSLHHTCLVPALVILGCSHGFMCRPRSCVLAQRHPNRWNFALDVSIAVQSGTASYEVGQLISCQASLQLLYLRRRARQLLTLRGRTK